MKIIIGTTKDKNINNVVQQNMLNGYTVFKENDQYHIEILKHNNVFISPDVSYLNMVSGQYEIRNGTLYLVE
jgi:hypothetical protein